MTTPSAYEIATGELLLRDGVFWANTKAARERWTFLSWDISGFVLF